MRKTSVLIVDDNKIMRDILQGILVEKGYTASSCEDGPSALKLASAKYFEIVLTDFQMPEMNGDEVVRLLRQQNSEIYIIGFSLADKQQVFLEAGANQYISKEQLFDGLIQALESRVRLCL